MLKQTANKTQPDKISYTASFILKVVLILNKYILDNLKGYFIGYFHGSNKYLFQLSIYIYNLNLYKKVSMLLMVTTIRNFGYISQNRPDRGKLNHIHQREIKKEERNWRYQYCTEEKSRGDCEDINLLLKLYSSILKKYRYTSLELTAGYPISLS